MKCSAHFPKVPSIQDNFLESWVILRGFVVAHQFCGVRCWNSPTEFWFRCSNIRASEFYEREASKKLNIKSNSAASQLSNLNSGRWNPALLCDSFLFSQRQFNRVTGSKEQKWGKLVNIDMNLVFRLGTERM